VDRRDRFEPLGQEQAHAIAAIHAPARQAGGHAVGRTGQLGEVQRSAPLVLDGGMVGPGLRGPVEQLAEVASVRAHG
jgi:hypothetical protein